jgi:hypothetical protein
MPTKKNLFKFIRVSPREVTEIVGFVRSAAGVQKCRGGI